MSYNILFLVDKYDKSLEMGIVTPLREKFGDVVQEPLDSVDIGSLEANLIFLEKVADIDDRAFYQLVSRGIKTVIVSHALNIEDCVRYFKAGAFGYCEYSNLSGYESEIKDMSSRQNVK